MILQQSLDKIITIEFDSVCDIRLLVFNVLKVSVSLEKKML